MADRDMDVDWGEVVRRGIEGQELDYKAAQDWVELSRAGKAKFARHAMAMANSRGGYIVVGVGEDANGNPVKRTGLTEKQLRSFDPSMVGQTVNRYADPSVEFDIVRPEVDGKHYAIFVIQRFATLPHVCSDSCNDELQRGVFYIRTPDARSRAAYRASELHALVQRALRNQRQVLGRMLRGVLYEGRQYAEPTAEHQFRQLVQDARAAARRLRNSRELRQATALEVIAMPAEYQADRVSLADIKRALQDVSLPTTAALQLLGAPGTHTFFTNRSLRVAPDEGNWTARQVYWEVFQTGLLYHVSQLGEGPDALPYPRLSRRVAAVLSAVGQAFVDLGMEEELLRLSFRLFDTEGCVLTDTHGPHEEPCRCYIPEVEVEKQRTVADLASAPAENAFKVVKGLCERFNYPPDQHTDLPRILREFLGHQQL